MVIERLFMLFVGAFASCTICGSIRLVKYWNRKGVVWNSGTNESHIGHFARTHFVSDVVNTPSSITTINGSRIFVSSINEEVNNTASSSAWVWSTVSPTEKHLLTTRDVLHASAVLVACVTAVAIVSVVGFLFVLRGWDERLPLFCNR